MPETVDLFANAEAEKDKTSVCEIDAAKFTEIPLTPRVIADSQCYLAYSLKNRCTLRVVNRATLVKGSVRAHTAPIHAVKFVNYRSNVVASAAENEFCVWVVIDDPKDEPADKARLTVRVYFKLVDPVTIRSFSFFINTENRRPDLLLLYDKQAAILESSSLIARFDSEPLQATLQENSTPLRELNSVGEHCLCSVGSGGWFAFTTEPTMVAACTLRNRSTPSWVCCEGAPVRALHLLHTAVEEPTILVVASANTVYQWTLTGDAEPSLVRKFTVAGSIVVMESSQDTFAVFDKMGNSALVTMESQHKYSCMYFSMPGQVRPGGLCYNRINGGSLVLVDKSDKLTILQLKKVDEKDESRRSAAQPRESTVVQAKSSTPLDEAATATATSAAPVTVASTSPASRVGSSIIANLVNQLGIPARASPYGHTTSSRPVTAGLAASGGSNSGSSPSTMAATPTVTVIPATAQNTNLNMNHTNPIVAAGTTAGTGVGATAAQAVAALRPALHNASLPQAPIDGVLAAAMHQSEEDVRQFVERLQSAMANTAQVLHLVPDTIRRDHEQLLNLSLEAQMTELQQTMNTSPVSVGVSSSVYSTFALTSLITPLSANLAKGTARGVEEALTRYLDHEVRNAIGNRVRNTQKQIIKNRLDEALKESAAHFVAQVEQSVQGVLKRELVEALSDINGTVTSLVKENSRLQGELDAMMGSGVVEELRRTREELRVLRSTLAKKQSGGVAPGSVQPGAAAARRPSPETILSTVQSLMKERNYRQGLEYLNMAADASLTLQLFVVLSHDNESLYSALIEDTEVPDAVWCQTLTLMVDATAKATVEDKETVLNIIIDVLSEREFLLQSRPGGVLLAEGLEVFARYVRNDVTSSSALQNLRSLEKRLQ